MVTLKKWAQICRSDALDAASSVNFTEMKHALGVANENGWDIVSEYIMYNLFACQEDEDPQEFYYYRDLAEQTRIIATEIWHEDVD